jgi:hypothetical protein
MDQEWIVEVKDDAKAAVTTATVALVQTGTVAGEDFPFTSAAATHAHKAAGVYEASAAIAPVAGDWLLIVRVTGKSPVVQPLKMSPRPKGDMATLPSPRSAATVAFTSTVRAVGKTSVRQTRFKVTIFPSSEIVFISGTDYFNSHTTFRIFAENYRNGLRAAKKVDNGVIATLFSTDDRSRETHVPAAGSGFVKVASESFGPTTGITPGTQHAAVAGSDIAVTDMYKYLNGVGFKEPGRVKEVGFFSHSHPGGPILFNTTDHDRLARPRDSTDFDARIKDFNAINVVSWPNLKAAMAAKATWHVWGCSATTHHLRLEEGANTHKKDGDLFFFTVDSVTKRHHGEVILIIKERTTRARVRFEMDARFRAESYMAAAATFLGIPVFGAPPGVGSSFDQKRNLMFIDTKEYGVAFAYFRDQFSPEFVPTDGSVDKGYVDYKKLADQPAALEPPFSSEYFDFERDFRPTRTSPIGQATISFADGRTILVAQTPNVTLTVSAKTGFASPGQSGHLYEVTDTTDPTKSVALYLQEDKQLFGVNKDSAGRFTVLGPRI